MANARSQILARPETDIFADMRRLCAENGFVHALCTLSFRDTFIGFGEKLTANDVYVSYSPSRLLRTELSTLIGLLIQSKVSFEMPTPSRINEMIVEAEDLLSQLHSRFQEDMTGSSGGNAARSLNGYLSTAKSLREPIFYGGESAYQFQYRDFSTLRYDNDRTWFKQNVGFSPADSSLIVKSINDLIAKNVLAAIADCRTIDPADWTLLPGFRFTASMISDDTNLDISIVERFLERYSVSSFPTNSSFSSVNDYNVANSRPIIAAGDNSYICLSGYALCEAIYDSPFYWMIGDKQYRNVASENRGSFTEYFVADRFSSVFDGARVYRGVNLKRSNQIIGEIDVLVIFGDRAIIVQCKSKKLTIESRKVNDLQLQNDFKKSIQDSYDQCLICAKNIEKNDIDIVSSSGEILKVPALSEIYPLCVISDHYPALSLQVGNFLQYEKTDKIKPPFVADLFLVDILAETLDSPLRLLSYIQRRVFYGDRVNASNELTVLAYHLRHNLWLDDDISQILLSDDIGTELDTAMFVRRDNLPGDPELSGAWQRVRKTRVGRLISQIERADVPAVIDFGFMLLSISGEAVVQLSKGLDKIERHSRSDRKLHDFTALFGDEGVTIHTGVGNLCSIEKITQHCERRKYQSQAKKWFGVAIDADSGNPVLGTMLDHPWIPDKRLEQLTKGMSSIPSALPSLASIKVGRNQTCPCGSGKKYKKCCLYDLHDLT